MYNFTPDGQYLLFQGYIDNAETQFLKLKNLYVYLFNKT